MLGFPVALPCITLFMFCIIWLCYWEFYHFFLKMAAYSITSSYNFFLSLNDFRKFYILNPTNKAYSYEWISEDEMNPKNFTGFSCLSPKGNVSPGKQAEVSWQKVQTF